MILYIETNFPMGVALGRDEDADELLRISRTRLRLALPVICVMEAWSAFEDERIRRNRFRDALDFQRAQLHRDLTSPHAGALRASLERAIGENTALRDDIDRRLKETLSKLAGLVPGYDGAELISLNKSAFERSLGLKEPPDPTDALILAIIVEHARRRPTERKVLLSGNTRDFDTPTVRALLAGAGIDRYFASTRAFLGWFRAGAP